MIRGSLDRLHLGDLLQWLQMGGLSGRLSLSSAGVNRHFDLLDGRVVYVSSSAPDERLASWLAGEGLLAAQRLRIVLGRSMLERMLFTEVLLDGGDLDKESLRASLTRLGATLATQVMIAPAVDFVLDPAFPVRDLLNLDLNVSPSALLLEAARRTDECPTATDDPSTLLPLAGEAFEDFFWTVLRQGLAGHELIDGEGVASLHRVVRDITRTLGQWLGSSPGLVPMPAGQVEVIRECLDRGTTPQLASMPQVAWNQMVLACSVRSRELAPPTTLDEAQASAEDIDLWKTLTANPSWQRPAAARLDELTSRVVDMWSSGAAAAAPHFDVDPAQARLAAHLLAVPTDLVLWVLAGLPLPHAGVRIAVLRELPRRLGLALARLVDLPRSLGVLLEPESNEPLGICLEIARAALPSAQVWPAAAAEDEGLWRDVASAATIARGREAAMAAMIGPGTSSAGVA